MNNPFVLGPVFLPLIGAVICLVLSRRNQVQRIIGFLMMLLAWACSIIVLASNLDGSIEIYRLGGWQPPYGIVLVADLLSSVFSVMATTVLASGALYALHSKDKSVTYPAFMPLFLCMSAGLCGALYTGDLFTLFVFVELMVISSVTLVAISDNQLGLEAAIKYLLISALGSLFLLLAIGAIYASFGTLNLADIARLLETEGRPLLASLAAVMLACAFLLKSAVFPFHFWQPDFHTTAPTMISAMLSSVVVKVGVYGLIRMVTLLFIEESAVIEQILIVLGIVGIFFGSLSALRTYDAKRILAYSTFGQVGFILVGIGWGTPLALSAAIVYAVNHALIKSSLLMLTGVVSSRTQTKTARLSELGGVGNSMRLTGGLYFLGALALAGVPPMNGFISKVALVRGGINVESWVTLGLVVSAGILTLLYMTRTWQLIFQRKPDADPNLKPYGDSPLAPALLISLCVILGLFALPLIDLAQITAAQLSDPSIYIQAVLGG